MMMNRILRSLLWVSAMPLALLGSAGGAKTADAPLAIEPARIEKTALCTDGKSHYIAVAPHDRNLYELFYGDGKKFFQVEQPPPMTLTGLHFRDPRVVSTVGNPNFRGVDVREFSEVEFDPEKALCSVRCGDRVTKLSIVAAAQAQTMLKAAAFLASPQQYRPYALVRDDQGTYYYVDRGIGAQNQRSFRMFKGPKGSLTLMKMSNVVSDSEGDIFATPGGSLRLILDRHESSWVENEKSRKLTVVPVEHNLHMIYTELGVYSGQALGTPCDHL